jgi:hypothetical protein
MRKITEDMADAFWNGGSLNRDNTKVFVNKDGENCVQLHNTIIARITWEGYVVLNNGDYYTNTTKERLNGVLSHLGMNIAQKQGAWRVYDTKGTLSPFVDGMSISL